MKVLSISSSLCTATPVLRNLARERIEGLKHQDGEVLEVGGLQLRNALDAVRRVVAVFPHTFCKVSDAFRQLTTFKEPIQSKGKIFPDFPSDEIRMRLILRIRLGREKRACRGVEHLTEHCPTRIITLDCEAFCSLVKCPLDGRGHMLGALGSLRDHRSRTQARNPLVNVSLQFADCRDDRCPSNLKGRRLLAVSTFGKDLVPRPHSALNWLRQRQLHLCQNIKRRLFAAAARTISKQLCHAESRCGAAELGAAATHSQARSAA